MVSSKNKIFATPVLMWGKTIDCENGMFLNVYYNFMVGWCKL